MIIDFYFDFMSPYAYLACSQIPRLEAEYAGRVKINSVAFDMWAARLAAGNNGPSNREQPAKLKLMMADVMRWARRYGIPLAQPKGFDSAKLNCAFWVANEQGSGNAFMAVAARKVWGEGGDPADPQLIMETAAEVGLNGATILAAADSDRIKALYADVNTRAQADGIFGAPIFVVGEERYWGNDRIDFVKEHIDAILGERRSQSQSAAG